MTTHRCLAVLFVLVGIGVCSARATDKKPAKITYEQHVMPLFREKCFSCHGPDRKSSGLRLDSYTSVKTGGASGEAIKPGDPDNSLLYKLVTHQAEPHMPPKSPPLPKECLDLIQQWIAGGAPENAGSKVVVVNKPKHEMALGAVAKGKPQGPPPMPAHLNLEPVVRTTRANAISALAASPWAPLVAVGGQKEVVLYHSDTLALLGVLPFPEGDVHVLKFSRNGGLLLAGGGHEGKSGRVVVWDVKTGERIFQVGEELDAVLAADISSDQAQIALGGPSKVVRVYSTKDGKLLHEIKKHTDWVYALEYSPDGVLLASGDRNGGLFVWEAHTAREYFSLRGHTAAVTDVCWRPDSNVLASCSEDGTVRLWEMENGGQIKAWGAGGGVESVKYSMDGRLVTCARDRHVRVWDGNGAQQRIFEPLPDLAMRAVFSHDSARVVAGDWSGQIRAWDTADGRLAGNLRPNPPSLAEQIEEANKALAARQAAHEQLVAAAAASQASAGKAEADLAAARRAAEEAGMVAKGTAAGIAKAKEASDRAAAALASAQAQVAARKALADAFAEAAAKVKDAAAKAKDNHDLAAARDKSQQVAAEAAADLAAAQKLLGDLAPVARTTAEQLASAHQTADQYSAAVKAVDAKTAAGKAAAAKAAADKSAVDRAAADLNTARAVVEYYKSASALAKAKAK
jgi:WD40 repeat protein